MFYEVQPTKNRNEYKRMLSVMGMISRLFSESDCPYLPYRAHENIFCKYLEADNLARSDCSADVKKDKIGVGLKTWMGGNDQKVAEFGKLKPTYTHLTGIDLVKKIAEYRNERIRVTMKLHGIEQMIYHVVRRVPNAMEILECAFDPIDIGAIKLLQKRSSENNTYFTDGRHTYHFSVSKNTLYMIFDDLELMDSIEVEILDDPYELLIGLMPEIKDDMMSPEVNKRPLLKVPGKKQLCLPLYTVKKGEKIVAEKSGLNQWNASGRKRNPNELYIPYNAEDRERSKDFFPGRDKPFTLRLPDGKEIKAKVCQDGGKAIMSDPNKDLGKWLLRDVLELPENKLITYEMLVIFGIDCVVFTKNDELDYSIDFAEAGTYEAFYGLDDTDE